VRLVACVLLGIIQVVVFVFNMVPQFATRENENFRRGLYSIVLFLTVALVLVWLIWLATREKIRSFLG
jgi:dolichol kinase